MEILNKDVPIEFKEDIRKAVAILVKAGCSEVYIFGSIARGEYHDTSDIDIAVKGLPKKIFFKTTAELMSTIKHGFDLVEMDEDTNFSRFITENEVFIRVA